ncbi:MAG: GreA/GreB family elongation factor [Bacteroidota bacterium]|nr:GreA/GreB family elongation factor [Bacteroidota bacterium]
MREQLKRELKNKCIAIIEKRISAIRLAMEEAQYAANNEEKSSAGDKYETSRAMSHLEKNMQATQLAANLLVLKALFSVNCEIVHNTVQKGSFVTCDTMSFFIIAGLGKLIFNNEEVLAVSPNAPVARLLLGKKPGDHIIFNNKKLEIKSVF